MARSVNKVTLIGTLGRDPEVRYLPNGNAVANLLQFINQLDKGVGVFDREAFGNFQHHMAWRQRYCFQMFGYHIQRAGKVQQRLRADIEKQLAFGAATGKVLDCITDTQGFEVGNAFKLVGSLKHKIRALQHMARVAPGQCFIAYRLIVSQIDNRL